MNKRIGLFCGLVSCAGLLALIFDSKTAVQGAGDGLLLCIRTLIPSLFPFFFLSNLLSASVMGHTFRLLRPIGHLCRIPQGAEYIFLAGLLGGYPTGAQCISDAVRSGTISHQNARRMLCFCNNCGPAFMFGISTVLFSQWWIPWLLFGIHIFSALVVGKLVPGGGGICKTISKSSPSPVRALNQAVRSMAGVCGWVVIFRTMLAFLQRWILWYFPIEVQSTICGLLELSNGCISLHSINGDGLRFILCAGYMGFGGLCVAMQTWFAADNVDKSLYFPGKILQCCISMSIAAAICGWLYGLVPAIVGIISAIYLRKAQKICRNLQTVDV